MNYTRKFIAFCYLLFTVLVNVQSAEACTISTDTKHSCCCANNAGCEDAEMNCCADAPTDDAQHFDHSTLTGTKIVAFKAPLVAPFSLLNFAFESIHHRISSAKPPPNQKVYLIFHQLLLYA